MIADLPQFVLFSGRVPATSSHSAVFRYLSMHPDRSRSAVSDALGLAKSAVGRVVRELIDGGWLAERDGAYSATTGRPGTPLMLNDQRLALLGAEVGLEEVRAVAVSLSGDVIERVILQHGRVRRPETCIKMLVRAFEGLSQPLLARGRRVVGIGVALPGAVDATTGHLHHAPHLKWRDVAFAERLTAQPSESRLAGVPLFVRNEADAAAGGESQFNAGGVSDPLLFLSVNVGVGVGVVVDGRLLTGHGGFAGEVGHMVLQIDGPACSCGRHGCAEALIVPAELRRGRAGQSIDELRRRLTAGDRDAVHTVQQAGINLGVLMNNLVAAFDPALMVLGGAMVGFGAAFLEPARQTLKSYAAAAGQAVRPVRIARFGEEAVALGAAAVVREVITRPPHALQAFFGSRDLPERVRSESVRVFSEHGIYRNITRIAAKQSQPGRPTELNSRLDALYNTASTLYWNKYAVESAQAHGLSPFYWSTPNAPFRYDTGAITNPELVTVLTGGEAPPPPNGAPKAVTGLTARMSGTGQVSLSWNPVTGATSYQLYRSSQSGYQPATPFVTGISGTSYVDAGLNEGTTYYYQVVAVNAAGPSGFTTEAFAAMPGTNPDPAKFSFETDTQRWFTGGSPITGIATSPDQHYAGKRSLAVSFSGTGAGQATLSVSGANVPPGGTVSFRVWVPAGHQITSIETYLQDRNWGWTASWNGPPTAGAWNTLTFKVPSTAVAPLQRLGLKISTGAAWTGTLYVDSVDWSAP